MPQIIFIYTIMPRTMLRYAIVKFTEDERRLFLNPPETDLASRAPKTRVPSQKEKNHV
ncbi:MAG: hypothetical protein IJQ11_06085 [Bacteroidales bacterium]|nr:hypothetical protein [Bacteroidales bacterium]